ncbi:MAG: glycerol-3-phosphate dehydrogenase/oxidase [Bacteroidales bacterium]|nr:glycerol-3-phosphate dehydrogenase/oxidase [Bacteroidales bacterium]
MYNREEFIRLLKDRDETWDFIVIGGGATGLGIAVDASSRGYRTILLEQSDFSKSTSCRSTKLVHGGVRYLQKGDVGLVMEALRERGLLLKNAPHLVRNQRFVIATYQWWEKAFYTIGLTLYDLLSGRMRMGFSHPMSREEAIKRIPQIEKKDLTGGVSYHDGQFDDSRLAVNLMQTAADNSAVTLNHFPVTGLLKNSGGKVCGVIAEDAVDGGSFELKGRCIINATGIFVDDIIRMDNKDQKPLVRPSQGVHLVVAKSFLGAEDAIMVPRTSDGRVMFGVPWHNRVILGTTDIPVNEFVLEPKAREEEIEFILETAGRYLSEKPQRKDVLCVFAGLRPLAAPKEDTGTARTKEISRSHKLIASKSGLVTITGGKWTTYRKMAEDTVNMAVRIQKLPSRKCITYNLMIHGATEKPGDDKNWLSVYGSDSNGITGLYSENPRFAEKLHPSFDFTAAGVVWAVRHEMARTVDDVLSRRVRALYLDARASVEMAPAVASLMAVELKKDKKWEEDQVSHYTNLASSYIL